MKQIEQEKEVSYVTLVLKHFWMFVKVLMNGLGAVERARDWYLKQIAVVQDKMKYLGRMGHVVSDVQLEAEKNH